MVRPLLEHRTWGDPVTGAPVVLLHGGPGAPGTMAPVARELAARGFFAIEPFERRSGEREPATVAGHVSDLAELLEGLPAGPAGPGGPGELPALVGSSWGAMLGLAFAATHPDRVRSLALVGCGTFDAATRGLYRRRAERAVGPELARRLGRLERELGDPDARLAEAGRLLLGAYSFDLLPVDPELERCDARGHGESWEDMLRLQREETYPQAFAAIRAPVLMLHGDRDPHPGRATYEVLRPHLGGRIRFRELADCGHCPWLERRAAGGFYRVLCGWLRAPGG